MKWFKTVCEKAKHIGNVIVEAGKKTVETVKSLVATVTTHATAIGTSIGAAIMGTVTASAQSTNNVTAPTNVISFSGWSDYLIGVGVAAIAVVGGVAALIWGFRLLWRLIKGSK